MVNIKNKIMIFSLLPFFLASCDKPSDSAGNTSMNQLDQKPPTEIGVVTVNSEDIRLENIINGRVVSKIEAQVRPQITGIIEKQNFVEGSHVNKGDILYEIDSSKYQSSVLQANASLNATKAELDAAYAKYKRYKTLVDKGSVSKQDYDVVKSEYYRLKASLDQGNASLESSKIDLGYTKIKAPIDGVIGRSNYHQGALVTQNQESELATIRMTDPVYVDLNQSLDQFYVMKKSGNLDSNGVSIYFGDNNKYDHEGKLKLSEAYMNEDTGTVALRIEIPNPDGFLLPGMYVRASVYNGTINNGFLVPQQGVSRDQQGKPYVFTVTNENVIERKPIVTSGTRDSSWIVSEGLDDGDKIVVKGTGKIGDGQKVSPIEIILEDPELSKTANLKE